MPDPSVRARPVLLFNRGCPPCVTISRLAAALSFGVVARVPLDTAAARDFYRRHPALEGMPVLVDGENVSAGKAIFVALPRVLLAHGYRRARALAALRRPDPSRKT
ncbi:hypothetical protein [Paraburkholderia sp. J12]|uniref:hypothetical protein n=1 Tax=Paraburkholderia sp. J12 TaxID=2805432 RepID=UPI002ABD4652|nr:hypothetical protein [Paraburkholderia sp. J12]